MRTQTTYFAYGSNLHLEQMMCRCPESRYLSIGILPNHRWQINNRGYANAVPYRGESIHGLVYLLCQKDEQRLDASEGVSTRAYEKRVLDIEVFSSNALISGRRVREVNDRIQEEIDFQAKEQMDHGGGSGGRGQKYGVRMIRPQYHSDVAVNLEALVYVSTLAINDGAPRAEYINRLCLGMRDAIGLGVSSEYFQKTFQEPMSRSTEPSIRDSEPMGNREQGIF